jgi:hypothetical protein
MDKAIGFADQPERDAEIGGTATEQGKIFLQIT